MSTNSPARRDIWVGRVVRRRVAAGSKSEHAAVVLETAEGTYVLRRVGGNAFQDGALDELVGREIEAHGTLVGVTLLLDRWTLDPGSASAGEHPSVPPG